MTNTPIGIRLWYNPDRFYQVAAADFATQLPTLPKSGWLIAMLYYVEEWAPGKKYRLVLMGTENFIFNPNGEPQKGYQFENTDESFAQAKQRLGNNIVYINGVEIENNAYMTILNTAMNWWTWPD